MVVVTEAALGDHKSQNYKGKGLLHWTQQLWLQTVGSLMMPFFLCSPITCNGHGYSCRSAEENTTEQAKYSVSIKLEREYQETREYLEEQREGIVQESKAINCSWSPILTSEAHMYGSDPNYREVENWLKRLLARTQTGHWVMHKWSRSSQDCKYFGK